ncbi:hypothetical protein ELZ22_03965 [Brucella abortus]|nr:hypothetical protein DMP34_08665 [Brucella abortus]PXG14484.1 hypothetical protein DMP26_03945 [Brucella abortus]RUQ82798.1 hypothetical protein ELZ22_03965 [Brucella abortus]
MRDNRRRPNAPPFVQSGSCLDGIALTICFVAFSNASERDQKSVQWTDFPRIGVSHFWLENALSIRICPNAENPSAPDGPQRRVRRSTRPVLPCCD